MGGLLRSRGALAAIAIAAVVGLTLGYVMVVAFGRSNGTKDRQVVGTSTTTLQPGLTGTSPTTSAPVGGPGTVPNVVGVRLPDAEQALRTAGYDHFDAKDSRPDARVVVEPVNWIVVTQEPAAGTPADPKTVVQLGVKKPTDDSPPKSFGFEVVPNVVCAELQAAQDALRSAGFLLITSKDGTGQGRAALVDRNWVVLAQSSPAGSKPGLTTHIELTVVKYGESPGDSGCHT
jgi:hypothetical protein